MSVHYYTVVSRRRLAACSEEALDRVVAFIASSVAIRTNDELRLWASCTFCLLASFVLASARGFSVQFVFYAIIHLRSLSGVTHSHRPTRCLFFRVSLRYVFIDMSIILFQSEDESLP